MPHVGYSDREVQKVYELVSEERLRAGERGRRFIVGGDFNAVVGKRLEGEAKTNVGEYGMGDRNDRGDMLVKKAMLGSLAIFGTMFAKREEHVWTHVDGGRKRQLDYSCVDWAVRRRA